MAEPYIKKLQNERAELVQACRKWQDWIRAVDHQRVTSMKGSALKEVERTERIMEDALKSIEPLLAE